MVEDIDFSRVSGFFDSALAERPIDDAVLFAFLNRELHGFESVCDPRNELEGNGDFIVESQHLRAEFFGPNGPYQLKIKLPQEINPGNGLTVRYRVNNWSDIRYLAIGHTAGKNFRHVKIPNPGLSEWATFSIGYNDLVYGLQNEWEKPEPTPINDVRLYLSGSPDEKGGSIEVAWFGAWRERATELPNPDLRENPELFSALVRYFKRCNPKIDEQVEAFLSKGVCPMTGDIMLPWPISEVRPPALLESGTYRYLWHAMQPAISFMVYSDKYQWSPTIYAARDYVNNWLEGSFYNIDRDTKYTWYDHGTAERLMAFLMMHEIGLQQSFDYRFMARLRLAILQHGQLLESEGFYAFHQPTRYHNHAWFQDMALIAAATALPQLPCAERWLDRSIGRLEDQLSNLIVRDGGYAIFIENSIGYHHGIQRLVEFAGELVGLSHKKSEIPAIAEELTGWSDFFQYPDGRSPSHGDTFRQPNPKKTKDKIVRGKSYAEPSFTVLPEAGYAVAKGNHEGRPWVLCMFATSLSKTHKHEDNLSITLWFDGIEWLVDPSMHSHDYCEAIPAYLRSARAHNNIAIPGRDYSIEPNMAEIFGRGPRDYYQMWGQHTAYLNTIIKREIEGRLTSLELQATDSIDTSCKMSAENCRLVFRTGEGVSATYDNNVVFLSSPLSEYILRISLPKQAQVKVDSGNDVNEGDSIGAIGNGFREVVSSDTVEILPVDNQFRWKLDVVHADDR